MRAIARMETSVHVRLPILCFSMLLLPPTAAFLVRSVRAEEHRWKSASVSAFSAIEGSGLY